jgi:hypothetical protein
LSGQLYAQRVWVGKAARENEPVFFRPIDTDTKLERIMRLLSRLVVFGGLSLLILGIAAWQMPASWIAYMTDLEGRGYDYARIRGTLWQGEAEEVKYRDLMLGRVKWDFKTLNQVNPPTTTWAIEANGIDYNLNCLVDTEGRQVSNIRLLQGKVPARWVDLNEIAPLVFLTGTFELDLDYVSPIGQLSNLASGMLYWKDAGLSGLVDESLGTVLVSVRGDGRFTYAEVESDPEAEIRIDGEVRINRTQYFSELTVRASEEKQYVIEQLAGLGSLNEDGSLDIDLSGNMPR